MLISKLKQYTTTKSPLQNILKEFLYTEDYNISTKGQEIKPQEKNKYSESSIELVAHSQILK
jgi:hypothetical protein